LFIFVYCYYSGDKKSMAAISLSIGGGKGGTGKSLVAANLAVTMAKKGRRVVLIDLDLGAANIHTMFGIDKPAVLLEDFFSRQVLSLNDALINTDLPNLRLICGGMPLLGTANPNFQSKMKLIRHIENLDTDVVILDIGAGTNFNVLDLFNAALIKVVVFTSQLTSVHNGYGFLKAALHRHIQRTISSDARKFFDSAGPGAGEESLADMLTRLADYSKKEAQYASIALMRYNAVLVGNMLTSIREGYVINAVSQMVRDHLHLDAPVIGLIRYGEKLKNSVNERRPFMIRAGIESNAELFRKMASTLLTSAIKIRAKNQEKLVSDAILERYKIYEREFPRFKIQFNVVLTLLNKNSRRNDALRVIKGVTWDISDGGVGVVLNDFVEIGTFWLLKTEPLINGVPLETEVKACHKNSAKNLTGFSFVNPDEQQLKLISAIVARAAASTAINPQNKSHPEQSVF
jgi:flagellar biosynthesis protein FlhG